MKGGPIARTNTANWFFAFVSNDFVNDFFFFFQSRDRLANWFSKATFPLRSVPAWTAPPVSTSKELLHTSLRASPIFPCLQKATDGPTLDRPSRPSPPPTGPARLFLFCRPRGPVEGRALSSVLPEAAAPRRGPAPPRLAPPTRTTRAETGSGRRGFPRGFPPAPSPSPSPAAAAATAAPVAH